MYICTYSETVTESEKRVLKVGHEGTWRYKATISETKWHNDKCCTDPTMSWTFVFWLKEFGVCKTWATYLALCEKNVSGGSADFQIWESSACWNTTTGLRQAERPARREKPYVPNLDNYETDLFWQQIRVIWYANLSNWDVLGWWGILLQWFCNAPKRTLQLV